MSIFKACDIRGVYGADLTEPVARRLGRAVGTRLAGQTVAVGGDVRLSTPALKASVVEGLVASGCRVLDLGIVPTPVGTLVGCTFRNRCSSASEACAREDSALRMVSETHGYRCLLEPGKLIKKA